MTAATILPQSALPQGIENLVTESEAAGFRFLRRLGEEWESGANRFDRPGEALFAALDGDRIIGIAGLNVDPYSTAAGVGRVRRLYVATAWRRQGVGRALVGAVIEAARGRFDRLRLRTRTAEAARFYETLGFVPRAEEAESTHVLVVTGVGDRQIGRL